MKSPFSGMDPYLEHPILWPDVHNSLMAAIRDALAPQLVPRYYIGLERRAYLLKADDLAFVGRPDIGIGTAHLPEPTNVMPLADVNVLTVELPMNDEVGENYLEIREIKTGKLVTVMELLSPVNKSNKRGRAAYVEKRDDVLWSKTNLVEIDLLRAGEPLPLAKPQVISDYRILVSRATQRPQARLFAFNMRHEIPYFYVPLLPGDSEPLLALNQVFHDLYARARYDARLDYTQPAVPPLEPEDANWAQGLIEQWQVENDMI